MIASFLKNSKSIILLLFFSLANSTVKSQGSPYNLVPNYSFEQYTICPSSLIKGKIQPPWYVPSNYNYKGGLYMNGCSSDPQWSIPINTWGGPSYQYAHTGNAYIGLYFRNLMGGNLRNYGQVKLIDSLIAGK